MRGTNGEGNFVIGIVNRYKIVERLESLRSNKMSRLLAQEETFWRQCLESGVFPFMWGRIIPS
jgi:hypothetical protein